MQQIAMFKAEDGSIHDTEKDCHLRDLEITVAAKVAEFLSTCDTGYKRESMVKNIIIQWEKFKIDEVLVIQLDPEDVMS